MEGIFKISKSSLPQTVKSPSAKAGSPLGQLREVLYLLRMLCFPPKVWHSREGRQVGVQGSPAGVNNRVMASSLRVPQDVWQYREHMECQGQGWGGQSRSCPAQLPGTRGLTGQGLWPSRPSYGCPPHLQQSPPHRTRVLTKCCHISVSCLAVGSSASTSLRNLG